MTVQALEPVVRPSMVPCDSPADRSLSLELKSAVDDGLGGRGGSLRLVELGDLVGPLAVREKKLAMDSFGGGFPSALVDGLLLGAALARSRACAQIGHCRLAAALLG